MRMKENGYKGFAIKCVKNFDVDNKSDQKNKVKFQIDIE